MPIITIKLIREKLSVRKKAELIKGATELVVRVLAKDPETTFVVIEEVALENWGLGGRSVAERRKIKSPATRG